MMLLLTGCPEGGGDGGFGEAALSNVAVSAPNGSFLYVSNRGLNSISAYTLEVWSVNSNHRIAVSSGNESQCHNGLIERKLLLCM